jgi:ABC-type Na+ efflux pump permease subunit
MKNVVLSVLVVLVLGTVLVATLSMFEVTKEAAKHIVGGFPLMLALYGIIGNAFATIACARSALKKACFGKHILRSVRYKHKYRAEGS